MIQNRFSDGIFQRALDIHFLSNNLYYPSKSKLIRRLRDRKAIKSYADQDTIKARNRWNGIEINEGVEISHITSWVRDGTCMYSVLHVRIRPFARYVILRSNTNEN